MNEPDNWYKLSTPVAGQVVIDVDLYQLRVVILRTYWEETLANRIAVRKDICNQLTWLLGLHIPDSFTNTSVSKSTTPKAVTAALALIKLKYSI